MPNLNATIVEKLPLHVPSPVTQRRIAAVLSAFDDLIEINERRIELLESVARSLYQEWFVRFRFPGHEALADDGESVPDGWTVRRFEDFAEVVSDGVAPDEVPLDSPYVGLEHLPRRQTTLRDWAHPESVTSRKLRFMAGDTLFGKIRPYFHKVVWAPFDGIASSDAIVLHPRDEGSHAAFVNTVAASDQLVAISVATSNGTKMPRADSRALLNYELAVPDDTLLGRFEGIARPLLGRGADLVAHNRALAATRDLLLPRLVTGRLDIDDINLGDLLSEPAPAT